MANKICRKCKTNECKTDLSGNVNSYCTPCLREYYKQRRLIVGKIGALCPTCKTEQRLVHTKSGAAGPYCKQCTRAHVDRDHKRLRALKKLPPCSCCKERPRSAITMAYCRPCNAAYQRAYREKHAVNRQLTLQLK